MDTPTATRGPRRIHLGNESQSAAAAFDHDALPLRLSERGQPHGRWADYIGTAELYDAPPKQHQEDRVVHQTPLQRALLWRVLLACRCSQLRRGFSKPGGAVFRR